MNDRWTAARKSASPSTATSFPLLAPRNGPLAQPVEAATGPAAPGGPVLGHDFSRISVLPPGEALHRKCAACEAGGQPCPNCQKEDE